MTFNMYTYKSHKNHVHYVTLETLGLSMELNDDILVQTTSLHFIAFHASQSSSQKESKYILFRLNKLETRSTAVLYRQNVIFLVKR